MNVLLVFAGGGIGSVLRYLIGVSFRRSITGLPMATLLSNVTACVVFAGVVAYFNSRGGVSSNLRLLLLTGFCGGLSTFSSFGFETYTLLKEGMLMWATANILISTGLCLLMFYLIK
jgi:fluoride exporter